MLAGIAVTAAVYNIKPVIGDYIILPMIAIVAGLYITPRIASHLPGVSHLIHHFEREDDKIEFPFKGAFWYNLGIIAPVMLLPLKPACAVIIVLSVGDAASTIVGRTYGEHRLGGKSLEGFLGFLFFGGLAASALVSPTRAFALAFFGGIIEFNSWFDDNFLIPVGLTVVVLALGF